MICAQQAKPQGHSAATGLRASFAPSPAPLTCGELKADPGQSIWCPHTCLLRHLLGLSGVGRLAWVPQDTGQRLLICMLNGATCLDECGSDRACHCC